MPARLCFDYGVKPFENTGSHVQFENKSLKSAKIRALSELNDYRLNLGYVSVFLLCEWEQDTRGKKILLRNSVTYDCYDY